MSNSPGAREPGSTLAPEYAELEDLPGIPRGRVFVPLRMHQLERGAERLSQARAVIAGDRQAAALFRAVEREGSDDGVPADFQAAPEAGDVGGAIACVGEKVKRRPVVPDIVGLGRFKGRRVRDDPADTLGAGAKAALKAGLGGSQRRARQIEHGNVLEPLLDEMVDQPRSTAANVDNRRVADGTRLHDQFERRHRALLKPANLVLALRGVDVLPMGLAVGVFHKLDLPVATWSCRLTSTTSQRIVSPSV